jgi:hypothetical protein
MADKEKTLSTAEPATSAAAATPPAAPPAPGAGAPAVALPAGPVREPNWVTPTAGAPTGPAAIAAWMDCLHRDPSATIYHHPQIALAPSADPTPDVFADWSDGATRSLAILARRPYNVRLLPGLGRATLRGRKLVASHMLGDNSPESLERFTASVEKFLRDGDAECVYFEDVEVNSALWNAIQKAAAGRTVRAIYPGEPQAHWWIQFPEKAEDYWTKFSGKTRYTFRTKAKKLPHTFHTYRTPDQVPAFLEQAHRVSLNTWQTKRINLRIQNSPAERELWQRVAALGAFRSYILENEGRPLAFLLGVQFAGRFIYEEVGYDQEFAKQGPGTVLLFRVLEEMVANDTPRVFDFGFGHADYKEIFANHQTTSGPVLLVRRSFRPTMILGLDKARTAAAHRAKKALKAMKLFDKVRRIHRSK